MLQETQKPDSNLLAHAVYSVLAVSLAFAALCLFC